VYSPKGAQGSYTCISLKISPVFPQQKSYTPAKEPLISATEPYICAKEPYISTKEPYEEEAP